MGHNINTLCIRFLGHEEILREMYSASSLGTRPHWQGCSAQVQKLRDGLKISKSYEIMGSKRSHKISQRQSSQTNPGTQTSQTEGMPVI